MSTTWTDVNGRKWPVCSCQKAWLPAYQAELLRRGIIKRGLDVFQTIGGAPASGGTHTRGGATDTAQWSTEAVKVAREMGADATWHRPYNWDGRKGMEHCHSVLRGCPHMEPVAGYQVRAVDAGFNGLGANGHAAHDTGPRPLSHRTWQEGIAWAKAQAKPKASIRPMQFNMPDAAKLPDEAARIKAGVTLAKSGHPSLIGWNELVGIKKPGVASDFAHAVDRRLGLLWHMVKPTLPLNENYISYRFDVLSLVKQYPDVILEGSTGGRHLTRAVFKHRKSGLVFGVGETQLVENPKGVSAAQAAVREKDRQSQAKQALAGMKAMVANHKDCPFIIQGDMNTAKDLTALVKAGLKRTRTYADESTDRDATTYTNYAKTKPSINSADWVIDQQYVTPGFYVVGYTVLRDLDPHGNYVDPRPSDHEPIVSSIRPA